MRMHIETIYMHIAIISFLTYMMGQKQECKGSSPQSDTLGYFNFEVASNGIELEME